MSAGAGQWHTSSIRHTANATSPPISMRIDGLWMVLRTWWLATQATFGVTSAEYQLQDGVNFPPRPNNSVCGIGFTVVCTSMLAPFDTSGSSLPFHVVSATRASPYIRRAIVRSPLASHDVEIRCSLSRSFRNVTYVAASPGG